ncbi:MAG: hypothetical protein B6U85_02740 [Desulfurococcales archaeon ex4484_42]|nr:MAG: hypothetical protein B6U85_02740 [Desulfurococcales archaeon ex4484_42]
MEVLSIDKRLRGDMIKFYVKFVSLIMNSRALTFEFRKILSLKKRSQHYESLISTKCSISRRGKDLLSIKITSSLNLPDIIRKVDELIILCSLTHSTTGKIYRILGVIVAIVISLAASAITGIIPDIIRTVMVIAFITLISISSELFRIKVNVKTLNKALNTHKMLLSVDGAYAEIFDVIKEVMVRILRRYNESPHINIDEILDGTLRDKCMAILNVLGRNY